MKALSLVLAGLLPLLVLNGNVAANGGKRILCYYAWVENSRDEILVPEDIDATLCTHLVYMNAAINNETHEIYPQDPGYALYDNGGKGFYNRTVKLKEVNSNLKVLLRVMEGCCGKKIPRTISGRSNFIRSAVDLLQTYGFDGLQVIGSMHKYPNESYFGQLLSELRAEFDKYGFLLSTSLPETQYADKVDGDIDAIVRFCDFIILTTIDISEHRFDVTSLHSSMQHIKANVDVYLAKNVPAEMMLVTIPTFGYSVVVKNINETGLGAEATRADFVDDFGTDFVISYGQLAPRFKNQSEEWKFCREEESNAPYAWNKEGLWVSYDDPSSIATKCQYIVENNLGGAAIVLLDTDDYKGRGGEGRFPLLRAIHKALIKGEPEKRHDER